MQGAAHRGPRFDLARACRRLRVVVPRRDERRRPPWPHRHRLRRQRVLAVLCQRAAARSCRRQSTTARSTWRSMATRSRWAMTERRPAVSRAHGRSIRRRHEPDARGRTVRWCIDVDELTVPWPVACVGRSAFIRVARTGYCATLDARAGTAGNRSRHSRASNSISSRPALRWSGDGLPGQQRRRRTARGAASRLGTGRARASPTARRGSSTTRSDATARRSESGARVRSARRT